VNRSLWASNLYPPPPLQKTECAALSALSLCARQLVSQGFPRTIRCGVMNSLAWLARP